MSTITREFTREQLIEKLQHRITVAAKYPDVEEAQLDAAIFKIALASLEAEPAAYIRSAHNPDGFCFADGIHPTHRHQRLPLSTLQDGCYWKVTPLYTAPPAPVSVPAEVSWEDVPEDITEDDMALASAWAHGFNQCRAAMLQGAEPVTTAYKLPTESAREKALAIQLLSVIKDLGLPENCPFVDVLNEIYRLQSNSPVIPDGWVACSERMPPLKTGVIVGKWIGRSWATKWATYIPSHPEANSHGFIMPGGSWEPTHWMPIPAAPQQEA